MIELREGNIDRYTVTPGELGLPTVSLGDLAGGDAGAGAAATRTLLAGEDVPWRDIVRLNAAAGLVVGDHADDLAQGLALAADALDSGAAAAALDRWVEVSRQIAR